MLGNEKQTVSNVSEVVFLYLSNALAAALTSDKKVLFKCMQILLKS